MRISSGGSWQWFPRCNPLHQDLLDHLLTRVRVTAEQEGLGKNGFQVVINNDTHGGEAVPHLHLHILVGRPLE